MAESTVLVVDDEPRIVEFLLENLRADDFIVLTAVSGVEALDVLTKSRPDVILLDVVLPDMSGYELCRKIRSAHPVTDGWDPDVPIIMISAKVEYTDRVRGLTRGADDYVTKPFHYPGSSMAHPGLLSPSRACSPKRRFQWPSRIAAGGSPKVISRMSSTSSFRSPAGRSQVSGSVWPWRSIWLRPTGARSTFAARSVAEHVSRCDYRFGASREPSVRPGNGSSPVCGRSRSVSDRGGAWEPPARNRRALRRRSRGRGRARGLGADRARRSGRRGRRAQCALACDPGAGPAARAGDPAMAVGAVRSQ